MKVLVCVDESELSHSIIPEVCRLWADTSADIIALRVIEPHSVHTTARAGPARSLGGPVGAVDETGGVLPGGHAQLWPDAAAARLAVEDRGRAVERLEHEAQDDVDAVAATIGECARGVIVESDEPDQAIIAYARDQAVDVVAMATHSRGGVRGVVMGSVASSVVRRGVCPVLLFHPT
jgi:nucleotide-binding universal stress UspA family protein